MGADIDAASSAQVVIGKLRDDRVCSFNRKDVQKSHIAKLRWPSNLKCGEHSIALFGICSKVTSHLSIESDWIGVFSDLESGMTKPIGKTSDVEVFSRVDRPPGSGGPIARACQWS